MIPPPLKRYYRPFSIPPPLSNIRIFRVQFKTIWKDSKVFLLEMTSYYLGSGSVC